MDGEQFSQICCPCVLPRWLGSMFIRVLPLCKQNPTWPLFLFAPQHFVLVFIFPLVLRLLVLDPRLVLLCSILDRLTDGSLSVKGFLPAQRSVKAETNEGRAEEMALHVRHVLHTREDLSLGLWNPSEARQRSLCL